MRTVSRKEGVFPLKKAIYDPGQDLRFAHPVIDQDAWKERYLENGETIPYRYMH